MVLNKFSNFPALFKFITCQDRRLCTEGASVARGCTRLSRPGCGFSAQLPRVPNQRLCLCQPTVPSMQAARAV